MIAKRFVRTCYSLYGRTGAGKAVAATIAGQPPNRRTAEGKEARLTEMSSRSLTSELICCAMVCTVRQSSCSGAGASSVISCEYTPFI